MHALTLQAGTGNKSRLFGIFNSYIWDMTRNNIKRLLRYLVKYAQSDQLIVNNIVINRGQFHSSRRKIAATLYITESMVKTALQRLLDFGLISIRPLTSRRGSIYSITDFDLYIQEAEPQEADQQQDWSKQNPIKKVLAKVAEKVSDFREMSPTAYEQRQMKAERVEYKAVWTSEADDAELIASYYDNDPEALRMAKEDLNYYLIKNNKKYAYKNGHFQGLKGGSTPHQRHMVRKEAKELSEARNNIQSANAAHEIAKRTKPAAAPAEPVDINEFSNLPPELRAIFDGKVNSTNKKNQF